MKQNFHLIPAILLLIGIVNLPIGYYTFLRIIVSIGAVAVIVSEIQNSINLWIVVFGLIAVMLNPFIPVYLKNKNAWIPIDIITAILFIIKSFIINPNKLNKE